MLRKVYQRIARVKQEDKNTKDGWDASYREGYWDRLHAFDEIAHNAVVAGYCNAIRQTNDLRILDVGCGEGLLLDLLKMERVQHYLGIDISEVAIARAATRSSLNVRFKAVNIEDTKLEESYSIIFVNECAYYFKDLKSTIRKMITGLQDDGYIIVSMYTSRQTEALWKIFAAELKTVDAIELKNAKGTGWKVSLYCKA